MNGILVVAATKSEAAHVPKRFASVITDIGKVAIRVRRGKAKERRAISWNAPITITKAAARASTKVSGLAPAS